MKSRLLGLLTLCAFALMPLTVSYAASGDRAVSLNPRTQKIDQPGNFLAANGLLVSVSKTAINAKATATTTVGTVPTGQSFYVNSIQIVTTSVNAITGGATITVGSTGTAANSILTSTALANTPVLNGEQIFLPSSGARVLLAGDTLTFTVGTGATGTSQTLAVHVTGHFGEPSLSPTPTPAPTATATPSATPTATP